MMATVKRLRRGKKNRSPLRRAIFDLVLLAAVLTLTTLVTCRLWEGVLAPNEGPPHALLGDAKVMQSDFTERCGRPTRASDSIRVDIVVSDDKAEWLTMASELYMSSCPNTQLTVSVLEDFTAAEAIANGDVKPGLWAPSSQLSIRLLEERWAHRRSPAPLGITPLESLLSSPTVLLVWDERSDMLSRVFAGDRRPLERVGLWASTVCAHVPVKEAEHPSGLPGRWADWVADRGVDLELNPSDVERWGRVKFVHASPSRTLHGFAALYLMTSDVLRDLGTFGREPFARALEENSALVEDWLTRCQSGLEPPSTEVGHLVDAMLNMGADGVDGVVTPENYVFDFLAKTNGHGPKLRRAQVLYPEPTFIADHPPVLLTYGEADTNEANLERQEAAGRFVAFLRSYELQREAAMMGFRPSHPDIEVAALDAQENPFLRLRRYGIKVEPLEQAPRIDGTTMRSLIDVWQLATGRS